MSKEKRYKPLIRAVLTFAVFINFWPFTGALTGLKGIDAVDAAEIVPIPAVKPESAPAIKEARKSVSGLIDFGKIFENRSAGPVPAEKPAFSDQGALSKEDALLYQRIFKAQAHGDMKQAEKLQKQLSNHSLRGHVLYQRYMHPTAYVSRFEELQNWLALYADHPGADDIYNLALRKMPKSYRGDLSKPKVSRQLAQMTEPTMVPARSYRSSLQRSPQESNRVRGFKNKITSLVRRQNLTKAKEELSAAGEYGLDKAETDLLKAQIAAGFLYYGDVEAALKVAKEAVARSGKNVPQAAWVAGLVSWKKQNYSRAAEYFEIMAGSPYSSGWSSAAGAYWAARSHMRVGNVQSVSRWLEAAATHPRTFYGLMATRALGREYDFHWEWPEFTASDQKALQQEPAGVRALALVAAGQPYLAQEELLRLRPKSAKVERAIFAYANQMGLPAIAMRMASRIGHESGVIFDTALYPRGPWQPASGYHIDASLIRAIIRQESRFNPYASSPSGAQGLMQIMPKTAKFVAGSEYFQQGSVKETLLQPAKNLEIGQTYIQQLLKDRQVNGDLLSLLIAYNAGPGNLAKWKKRWPDVDDPLLFIELIPSSETRNYVERVLANFWIYRLREGLHTPTLEAMAEGKNAPYDSVVAYQIARR